ncbi:MAG: radical SAM/SPASM domain-containing protein [Planctomycetota bacterium]
MRRVDTSPSPNGLVSSIMSQEVASAPPPQHAPSQAHDGYGDSGGSGATSKEAATTYFVVSPRCLQDGTWKDAIRTFAQSFSHGQLVELALMRTADDSPEDVLAKVLEAVAAAKRRPEHVAPTSTHIAPCTEAGWAQAFAQSAVFIPSKHPDDAELIRIARGQGCAIALTLSQHNFHSLSAGANRDRVYTSSDDNALQEGRTLQLGEHTKAKVDLNAITSFPQDIQVEMSSKCNARCVMCPVSEGTPNVNIDFALFERIIEQCQGQPELKRFWFHLYGESLLHPQILDAWQLARERLPTVELGQFSNGSLMTEAKARIALQVLDTLVFSIDGATSETFDGIRKNLSYDEVKANVLRTIELKKELGSKTTICVNMTEMAENRHERAAFLEFWQAQDVFANVYSEMGKVSGRGLEPVRSVTPCYSPFVNLVVFSDGVVVPCCDDSRKKTPIGDVNIESIQEIWNGPANANYRNKHLLGQKFDLAACEACDNNRWRLMEGFF